MLQSAVIRKFEIIGEAATSISDETKSLSTTIPWHKIKGLRNILIHEYFRVDPSQLWETIKEDLPDLKIQGSYKSIKLITPLY